jgi:hypothetical protein
MQYLVSAGLRNILSLEHLPAHFQYWVTNDGKDCETQEVLKPLCLWLWGTVCLNVFFFLILL